MKEKKTIEEVVSIAYDIAMAYNLKLNMMFDCNSSSTWYAPIFFHCEKKAKNELKDSDDLIIAYHRTNNIFKLISPKNNPGFYQMEHFQKISPKRTPIEVIPFKNVKEHQKQPIPFNTLPALTTLLSLDIVMKGNIN